METNSNGKEAHHEDGEEKIMRNIGMCVADNTPSVTLVEECARAAEPKATTTPANSRHDVRYVQAWPPTGPGPSRRTCTSRCDNIRPAAAGLHVRPEVMPERAPAGHTGSGLDRRIAGLSRHDGQWYNDQVYTRRKQLNAEHSPKAGTQPESWRGARRRSTLASNGTTRPRYRARATTEGRPTEAHRRPPRAPELEQERPLPRHQWLPRTVHPGATAERSTKAKQRHQQHRRNFERSKQRIRRVREPPRREKFPKEHSHPVNDRPVKVPRFLDLDATDDRCIHTKMNAGTAMNG
ncbi:hypothetical protein FISHEDRAFT_63021 [Fistulina hepatica ATCC 64428]|uniref:Uncharacterized protein n=1 Tax=Fistulina hepatica ATCC 64428 TaxID=1128425 RepID=A0A0D6ZYV3_9AGAR|nr:hypothetical protein FISHEDRAFT_63021 [Fistulina hepatica ATCC 64428]